MDTETPPTLSFRAVEIFVAVVEQGSVTGAAKRLAVSPSTVSQQLSNLEASLGARLVERTAHTFMLTSAGDIFLPRAMKLLDEVSGARAALSGADRAPQMTLRISTVEDFDLRVTPYWLTHLGAGFRNCRFAIRAGASHENHSALADRSADMIVAVESADAADWVEAHPLLQDPYILVTAPDIPTDTTLEDLMRRPMVRYAREQFMARQIEAQLRRVGTTPPRLAEFSGSQGLLSMVAASGGWAITTALAYLGAVAQSSPLITRPAPLPAFSRTIYLYARRGALMSLPEQCARDLRLSLQKMVAEEAETKLPFLGERLRVLG
ncbi:MAG: LysR family transcriptional regulator [Pikeienuella sp.]